MKPKSMSTRFFNLLIIPLLALFSLCWFTDGYAQKSQYGVQSNPPTTPKEIYVPPFSSFDVAGPINVTLTTQPGTRCVTIFAPPEISRLIYVSVNNNTLVIDASALDGYSSLIQIKVNASQPMYQLRVRGTACVSGWSAPLHVIENEGTGTVAMLGINSPMVIVQGSSGRVVVSGKTHTLNAQIGGTLVLQAGGLEADEGYIRAINRAVAYVCVSGPLYGFAYGNGNIYYYGNPIRVVQDARDSGNVLKITTRRVAVSTLGKGELAPYIDC